MEVPFILTLDLEENAFQFFDALRKIYNPPPNNQVQAHLTLFHLLPHETAVIEAVAAISRKYPQLSLQVVEPVLTGNGVAYAIESAGLQALHRELQEQWRSFLIPQDLQEFRPHITIQKNAPPEEAGALLDFLKGNFSAFGCRGTGLQLWEHQGGVWTLYRRFPFATF